MEAKSVEQTRVVSSGVPSPSQCCNIREIGEGDPRRSGYKIVDSRLQGRNGFQYTIGKEATEEGRLTVCKRGLHYCNRVIDCINFCGQIQPPYRYLRVVAMSEVKIKGDKLATLQLMIQAELTPAEWIAQAWIECQENLHDYSTMLLIGISEGDIKTMKIAMAYPDINRNNPNYHAVAAATGRLDSMKFLVGCGFTNTSGALSAAVRYDHLNIAQFLLKSEDPAIMLTEVARYGSTAIAGSIIDSMAAQGNPAALGKTDELLLVAALNQALIDAASRTRLPMVKYLISRGANAIHSALYRASGEDAVSDYLFALTAKASAGI